MVENNIIMEEVLEVDENEVISKLEDHEKRISYNSEKIEKHEQKINHHEDEITALQIRGATNDERFNSIDLQFSEVKSCLTRIENNNYQSTNLLVSTISSIAQANSKSSNEIAKVEAKGETEITKIRLNNNTKLILKAFAVISGIILAYIGGKYGISVK